MELLLDRGKKTYIDGCRGCYRHRTLGAAWMSSRRIYGITPDLRQKTVRGISPEGAGGLATAGRPAARAHAGKEQGTHLDAAAVTCFFLPSGLADIYGSARCLSSRRPSARESHAFHARERGPDCTRTEKNDTHAV